MHYIRNMIAPDDTRAARALMIIVPLFSAALALIVAELLLRAFSDHPISDHEVVPHPELLYVMDSRLHEVDGDGFRNSAHQRRDYRIAAIGDSFTYGYNVGARVSWPARLQELTGQPVYNFGVGGYNVLQHYDLSLLALAHEANVVIALYPTNDLSQFFCATLALPHWQARVARMPSSPLCSGHIDPFGSPFALEQRRGAATLLARELAIYSLARHALKALRKRAQDYPGATHLTYELSAVREVVSRKVLSLVEHATDLDDPFILRNFEITLWLYSDLAERAALTGTRLAFVIIPSKERLLREYLAAQSQPVDAQLERTAAGEEALSAAFSAFFQRMGLPYRDAAAAWRTAYFSSIESGRNPWPQGDGHPYAEGYRILADLAAAALATDPAKTSP